MTTSLPLSKALFEKGLKIETEKRWVDFEETNNYELCTNKEIVDNATYNEKYSKSYFAPSTDELLAVMPIIIEDCHFYIETAPLKDEFEIGYHNIKRGLTLITDKFICEALGKMCLWLLGNDYHFNGKELVK